MICKLRKNDYPEIELLFGEHDYYNSGIYDRDGFEQADSISFNFDFYNQFLQEETEEEAKEWCLKTVERDIFEHLYEISEADTEDETNPPEKLADFYDDYEYNSLSNCFDALKEYSESVMHNIWISKQIFKVGQDFSVVRECIDRYGHYSDHTFNLFPEMYGNDLDFSFYISEISKFDSSSYKLELSMNKCYGDDAIGAIIEKLKFIIQKGDVLTFKYYQKDEKIYFVDATVTNIKNNEIEFEFELFNLDIR